MSWGCPHDAGGECQRVPGRACDPGMKGCILFGRFTFSNEQKNRRRPEPKDQPSEKDITYPDKDR